MVNQQLVKTARITGRPLFKEFGLISLSSPRIYMFSLGSRSINKLEK